MAQITLDDIRKAADDQYGPFVIEGIPGGDVTLLNALRLPKEQRNALAAMQKKNNAEDAETDDQEIRLHEMVRIIAASRDDAERLLEAIGGDLAALAVVLNGYGEAARLGGTSPSPS